MDDILTIPPVAGEMGLIAYECPGCGYVTSVLLQPDDPRFPTFKRYVPPATRRLEAISFQQNAISKSASNPAGQLLLARSLREIVSRN
jgi:hypothetical protein